MKRLSPQQQRLAVTLLLAAGTFVAATFVSRQVFESPGRLPEARQGSVFAARSAADASGQFRVAAIYGPVETMSRGRRYVVQAGDLLSTQDVISTPKGGRALLRRGGTEIEVLEGVDIRLDSLAAETASFGLVGGSGNVVASVGGAEEIRITTSDARAVSKGPARWVVSLGASGRVSVAASKGQVRFAAAGKEIALPEGTESTALPGLGPGDPEPIPEELLFAVIWPEVEETRDRAEISGKARPSSQVKVNGVEADVAADGSFTASVPLKVGQNKISIETDDISGRRKTAVRTIRRVAPAPTLEAADDELWTQ